MKFLVLIFLFHVWQAYAAAGTVNQNYANILLMLLRLRQACDHPFLVKEYESDSVGKDSLEMARRLPRDMLINLLNLLEASLAICSKCNVSFFFFKNMLLSSPSFRSSSSFFFFSLKKRRNKKR